MTVSASAGKVLLGLIALGLTAVEFAPLALGRSLFEITFLGIHVGATTAIVFLIIGATARRKEGDDIPAIDIFLALATCNNISMRQPSKI